MLCQQQMLRHTPPVYRQVGFIVQHTWVRAGLESDKHLVHLELTFLFFSLNGKIRENIREI